MDKKIKYLFLVTAILFSVCIGQYLREYTSVVYAQSYGDPFEYDVYNSSFNPTGKHKHLVDELTIGNSTAAVAGSDAVGISSLGIVMDGYIKMKTTNWIGINNGPRFEWDAGAGEIDLYGNVIGDASDMMNMGNWHSVNGSGVYTNTLSAEDEAGVTISTMVYVSSSIHTSGNVLVDGSVIATTGTFTNLTGIGGSSGDVLYNNGTEWIALSSGTAGEYFKTGTVPSWDTPAGGGDVLEAGDNNFTGYNTHTGSSVWTGANGEVVTEYGFFHDRGDPNAYDFDVSSFTADGAWYDLDLSAIVPIGAKTVLLNVVVQDDAAGSAIIFRENGNSNVINSASLTTQVAVVTTGGSVIVACDSNRVIEYQASSVVWTIINVVVSGWWK